jgi:hypothetical protein
MADDKPRRSFISLGEVIALAALIVSGFGAWIAWKSNNEDKPTRIVEQRQAIPLVLRAKVVDDGKALEIAPVEESHALQSLKIAVPGSNAAIDVGSDGALAARAIEPLVKNRDKDSEGPRTLRVRIEARYVEAGKDRTSAASYTLSYRWEGGGLFGGKSLRITGFSR